MKRRVFIKSLGAMLAVPTIMRPDRLVAHGRETDPYCTTPSRRPPPWGRPDTGITCETDASFYLSGNFAPVKEEITATDLEVLGELPKDLNGRYVRNGPNPFGEVDLQRYHWFIGDGMVHGVHLTEGRALWYRNRYVRSSEIAEGLGEHTACKHLAESPNTHIIGQACRNWAIMESGAPPVELSYELETIGANNFFGTLPEMIFTGHPKVDPDTGHLHAIAYMWRNLHDHIQYLEIGRDARVKKLLNIPMQSMPMIHDMSLTRRYVVIYDLSVTLNNSMIEQGMPFPFAWNNEHQARIGLLPRNGSAEEIIWIEIPACFVAHIMNAYDDEAGNVVIDACRYKTMFINDIHGPLHDSLPRLIRWTINPISGRISVQGIDHHPQEFPRCHPALNSKPYRYGYTVEMARTRNSFGFPAIRKHDMLTGIRTQHDLGAGRHSGEPYFVPRTGATAEDDGYLISFVYDENRNASELLVLDATDLHAHPLARVMLPVRVPYGFHGSWLPDDTCGPFV